MDMGDVFQYEKSINRCCYMSFHSARWIISSLRFVIHSKFLHTSILILCSLNPYT
ncbi:hypothetical protein K435DRAFT_782752 [Dendrothele bispora CBS 962.96]|uniref:Uncharacterized protein n=1 Tax=Dendrothele bispora (strain CBS 962.96) TaxID=1314807 RepID=A0A4S8LDQ2_DENBC|nr:hypothetical protein K435DRAFT_782751 [Dendrothele bispora CBS 962.96]THU86776.1 hypothetical protein K435DRAFT_782752 [Dendrothele bispora CBS 962.96]